MLQSTILKQHLADLFIQRDDFMSTLNQIFN